MDAFAIVICKNLSVEQVKPKHLLSAGFWLGGSQTVMPLRIMPWATISNLRLKVRITGSPLPCWQPSEFICSGNLETCQKNRSVLASFVMLLGCRRILCIFEGGHSPAILMIGKTMFVFCMAGVKIANHFGGALAYVMRGNFVWQIPILQSGH